MENWFARSASSLERHLFSGLEGRREHPEVRGDDCDLKSHLSFRPFGIYALPLLSRSGGEIFS